MTVFAHVGYLGTPVTAVAEHAQISAASVFNLLPTEEELFVAALPRCFAAVQVVLERGADAATDQRSETAAALRAGLGQITTFVKARSLPTRRCSSSSPSGSSAT